MKKRVLASISAVIIIIATISSVSIWAEEDPTIYSYTFTASGSQGQTGICTIEYTISDGEVTITNYIPPDNDYLYSFDIPSHLEGYPVTVIGERAFVGKKISVSIPNTVREIGNSAFASTSMRTLYLPDGIVKIGDNAFAGGRIDENFKYPRDFVIPDSVTEIGSRAFAYCAFYSVKLPDTLTTINSQTFTTHPNFDGIHAVTIPVSVTSIAENAFYTQILEKVYYAGTPSQWNSINGNGYLKYEKKYYNHPAHNFTYFERVEPTCTQDGHKAYYLCNICWQYFTSNHSEESVTNLSNLTLKATDHSFGEWTVVTPATYDEEGVEQRVCANDPSHIETQSIPKLIPPYGEVNGDGEIDSKDVTLLRRYLANYDYDTDSSSVDVYSGADCNGDGEITSKDVTLLRRYLANLDYDTGISTVVLGPQG